MLNEFHDNSCVIHTKFTMFLKISIVCLILFYKRFSLLKSILFIYFYFNTQIVLRLIVNGKCSKESNKPLDILDLPKKQSIVEKNKESRSQTL